MSTHPHIAISGNPNSGKSSLFNLLTGLRQQVGNFPGVTVEKKLGHFNLPGKGDCTILDLPGTYSLYPRREDEWVSYKQLMYPGGEQKIDLAIVVADASNLRRNLLYVSQVVDLKIPVVLALTMNDLAQKKGIKIAKNSNIPIGKNPVVFVIKKNKTIKPPTPIKIFFIINFNFPYKFLRKHPTRF